MSFQNMISLENFHFMLNVLLIHWTLFKVLRPRVNYQTYEKFWPENFIDNFYQGY